MEEQKARKKLILLVEDDPILIKMYKTKFETEGIQVIMANDGRTALGLMLKYRPNLVVLDIMMPILSGMDLLREYNAKYKGLNIPIIVLSNLSNEQEMKLAMQLGAKEYMVKANYTPKDVFEHAKKYLE
jgi:DNA-binding response OmpR family regulator